MKKNSLFYVFLLNLLTLNFNNLKAGCFFTNDTESTCKVGAFRYAYNLYSTKNWELVEPLGEIESKKTVEISAKDLKAANISLLTAPNTPSCCSWLAKAIKLMEKEIFNPPCVGVYSESDSAITVYNVIDDDLVDKATYTFGTKGIITQFEDPKKD